MRHFENTRYIKAIVIDIVNGRVIGRGPYRNIANNEKTIYRFQKKMKQLFPGAVHVNYYTPGGKFIEQRKYQVEISYEKRVRTQFYNSFFVVTGESQLYNLVLLNQW
jgi:hypothetical protein